VTRICWRLVDVFCRLLEPGERAAVCGDFAESGESGGQALRDVMGLVVRRQAALWKNWRPWLALVGLIVPLGMQLSIASRMTTGQSATYLWLYANNWDWALLKDGGFWYGLVNCVPIVLVSCLTLVCWSWTAGFVLGSLSRRIAPVYRVLFCLMLVFGVLWGAPRYLDFLLEQIRRPESPDASDPISALAFYRHVLPLIVQTLLVAVPSMWGMRRGAAAGGFPRWVRAGLWSVAITTLTLLLIRESGLGFILRAFWLQRIWQSWPIRWLQMVVYWPVAYLILNAIWRHWHAKTLLENHT